MGHLGYMSFSEVECTNVRSHVHWPDFSEVLCTEFQKSSAYPSLPAGGTFGRTISTESRQPGWSQIFGPNSGDVVCSFHNEGMDRKQLELILEAEGYPSDSYVMYGSDRNDTLNIEQQGDKFVVYYTERGIEAENMNFRPKPAPVTIS